MLTLFLWRQKEFCYEGKRISQWFREAVYAGGTSYQASPSFEAFRRMEGDAVPFLTGWVGAHPSAVDRAYLKIFRWLPSVVAGKLPAPRDAGFYSTRRNRALELLGQVGMMQRFKEEVGESSGKASIAQAIPVVRAALRDPSTRVFAAQALWFIGPPAAVVVPDLVEIAKDPNDPAYGAAVQSFGLIGPPADEAVEVLAKIAGSGARNDLQAIESLGGIGPGARSAAPALTSMLTHPNEAIRVSSARTLAQIGVTPNEAVPALLAMRQATNDWARTVAAFALWNRNTNDLALMDDLVSAFGTERRGWLAYSMGCLGVPAAPFLPEIQKLVDDPDNNVQRFAKAALTRIRVVQK
ncbi:MAG: HEAT repeat domain-containing protein [Verrucomicrobiales bacterium]|nr:HEAT repeat domain-containing protein [Verrucomicrobiales bacterium]